ncbi:gastrula zinc finger protein XlCGF9.1-like [Galendromus occidentalis]|uniref:Gastrula zinc finger protein XlCGF9.1-like n=1 Tax=Galendromus occidentalis TaxID=34638 RepID=A0AAJ6QXS0_9ACAR|nr:gastrula zinc finger protein XlCGF9.1-like [Galendromus occidentalis]
METSTKDSSKTLFRPWDGSDLVRPKPVVSTGIVPPILPAMTGYQSELLLSELWLAELDRSVMLAAGVEAASKLKKPAVQRPKKFQCPHCDVCFSNNGQLKSHIRIHTGERPFACEHDGCGKTFTRNEELTRHRRIHTGLRPFPCPVCQKPFGRKDHLKKHVKTHQRMVPPGLPFYSNPFW